MRKILLSSAAAALIGLAVGHKAEASEWGCEVLLCLSNPGGATQYSECVPPITRLYNVLGSGGSFPSCSTGGVSSSGMGIQLFRCEEGWRLKNSGALFGGNVCQSLTQTHEVCAQQSRGDREAEVCRDEPLEKKAERNPTPNYVDVSYTGADGQPVTQRVWFKLH